MKTYVVLLQFHTVPVSLPAVMSASRSIGEANFQLAAVREALGGRKDARAFIHVFHLSQVYQGEIQ